MRKTVRTVFALLRMRLASLAHEESRAGDGQFNIVSGIECVRPPIGPGLRRLGTHSGPFLFDRNRRNSAVSIASELFADDADDADDVAGYLHKAPRIWRNTGRTSAWSASSAWRAVIRVGIEVRCPSIPRDSHGLSCPSCNHVCALPHRTILASLRRRR